MSNRKILKENLFNIILLALIIVGGTRLLIVSSSDNNVSKKVIKYNNDIQAQEGAVPSQAVIDEVLSKSDKPNVELFVMSHCPYGTQIEKGILPVAQALEGKIDFQIKFVDYAMHGEKELKEQLAQYCIQKEQPKKFFTYLDAFLKDGESDSALKQSGVDQKKLSDCIAKTDKEFKVLENFKNNIGFKGSYPGFDISKADNKKYGVGGSPTLVINGSQNESGRDSNSLLQTICSAFNNPPKECGLQLSSSTPAPGFGTATQAGSASAGGCH